MSQAPPEPPSDRTQAPGGRRVCPFCGKANDIQALSRNAYRCRHCQQEMAHLEYLPNGSVKGIYGWLLAPGEVVLERYKIKTALGKGGFGAAYLVDDLHLNGRHMALKELPAPLFDQYEKDLLIRLDHPAIPTIIDHQAVAGMEYLVLKFGGSRTLGSERPLHPGGRIPLDSLLPWMRQHCEVLDYLHNLSPPIIHRDLKPDNILLDDNGRIMLIDFGIAKEAMPESWTRTMARGHSVHYSPPEQIMGTGTDQRADIYALGATFYTLLTGEKPATAAERVAEQPLIPPGQLVEGVPAGIEAAIVQALELNPNKRPQTVKEFALALASEVAVVAPVQPIGGEQEHTQTDHSPSPQAPVNREGINLPQGRSSAAAPPGQPRRWLKPLAGVAVVGLMIGAYLEFGPK